MNGETIFNMLSKMTSDERKQVEVCLFSSIFFTGLYKNLLISQYKIARFAKDISMFQILIEIILNVCILLTPLLKQY